MFNPAAGRRKLPAVKLGPQRVRGSAWMAIRARVLAEEPLCYLCGVRFSKQVDHKLAVEDGGHPTDRENLGGICEPCHHDKTAAENRRRAELRKAAP